MIISPAITNYRVKIKKIIPEDSGLSYRNRNRCYTGISISNPFFQSGLVVDFFSWILMNFDYCCVFIDDYFHQYNEAAFTGKDPVECIGHAREHGSRVEAYINKVIYDAFDEPYRFKIVKSTELAESSNCKNHSANFKVLFQTNEAFRLGIEKSAEDYVQRQIKRQNYFNVTKERAVELSCLYLIEEIAIFTTICDMGYDVEVYPGPELPILIDIAQGKFDNIPLSLKHRINIELKMVKKS